MRTLNGRRHDADETMHLARVKALPCACCKTTQKARDAHHTVQGNHFTTIPLCHKDCHQGPDGIHGTQALMRVHKVTENDMLNWTNRMLLCGTERAHAGSRQHSTRTPHKQHSTALSSDKIVKNRLIA